MKPDSIIKSVRTASCVLLAVNVMLLFGVKSHHSDSVNYFFFVSLGISFAGLITYLVARFRKQTEKTRGVIEAVTPLAMLSLIVLGIIVVCFVIPMIISSIG